MPEWDERPRADSIRFFEDRIEGHSKVDAFTKIDNQTYEIARDGRSDLRVWLCDVYRVSAADVSLILAHDPAINAIVTVSSWNDVSHEGKAAGEDEGVGVFQFKAFYGAMNYDGDDFVNYIPPDERE